MKHAAYRCKTVTGRYMAYDTLCGLDVNSASEGVTYTPDEVNCLNCKRSRSWKVYVRQCEELK